MHLRSLSHLSHQALLRDLAALVARDCGTTAELLAHIAEVDERRLFAPAGFPSMFAYCVQVLHMSEDTAFKRIRAARSARQFPAIFEAVADGRLHLSAVVVLAPYLTIENADELLATGTHKTRVEIECLLAERFPRPDLPERLEALSPPPALDLSAGPAPELVKELPKSLAPGPVGSPAPRAMVVPLSAERFGLQFSIERGTREKLRYAQALLGHRLPAGEIATVFDLALDAFIEQLERQKFCATSWPRASRGHSSSPRHIPAAVKRGVWERDGGRCAFVSEAGQRCPARTGLEFDHVDPVARGGEASVEGVRLRCRVHNQYEAECVFGAGFMSDKRAAAQARAEARKQAKAHDAAEEARARAAAAEISTAPATERLTEPADERDVTPYLRKLGYSAEKARHGAAACESIPDASLEERVRFALKHLMPPHRRIAAVTAA